MVVFHPQKVLVPTDFSDESARVVEDWRDSVDNPEELTILHVAPQIPTSEADLTIGWSLEGEQRRAEILREKLRQRFSGSKYDKVHFEVRFGTPATEIAKYAEEHHVDLIALPSHGRRGLARVLIGSVAERVVRLAHCPVLVMRH
jgi:nucleotide-binding universal stress UspA family protein